MSETEKPTKSRSGYNKYVSYMLKNQPTEIKGKSHREKISYIASQWSAMVPSQKVAIVAGMGIAKAQKRRGRPPKNQGGALSIYDVTASTPQRGGMSIYESSVQIPQEEGGYVMKPKLRMKIQKLLDKIEKDEMKQQIDKGPQNIDPIQKREMGGRAVAGRACGGRAVAGRAVAGRACGGKKGDGKRTRKDPTSYALFVREHFDEVKDVPHKERMQALADMWNKHKNN